MSTTIARISTFTTAQKFAAKFVLPLLFLFLAAALGSLIGGSTAPNSAHAAETTPATSTCIIVCGATHGGGGNIGTPAAPGTGVDGSGMGGNAGH